MSQSEPYQLNAEPGKERGKYRVHIEAPEHVLLRALRARFLEETGRSGVHDSFISVSGNKEIPQGTCLSGERPHWPWDSDINNPMYSARSGEVVACGICRTHLGLVLSLS